MAASEHDRQPQDGESGAGRSAPLQIALDLRFINHSGIGSYLSGLLHGFSRLRAPIQWTFIGTPFEVPPNLEVRQWIEFDAPLYSFKENRHYPSLAEVDLFHYPHYNLPRTRAPHRVVTVYDLFHLRYGSFLKRLYQRSFLLRLAWTRTPVIAISNKTRDDLLDGSWVQEERITTIDLGPGRPLPAGGLGKRAAIALPDGRDLRPPWLLALGIDKPHKNMDFLISAMALWYRRRPRAPALVWAGPAAEAVQSRVAAIPAHARAKIHVLPYGSADQIERLYAGALGLVFPSLDEGFGFPPLEAMARGVPVICSRRQPMTELLGKAPLWFDSGDSATLWRALDALLDNHDLHLDLIERGTQQVQRFSWLETARRTFELYQKIVGEANARD